MNARDLNKIEMYKTTQRVLDANTALWVVVVAFTFMKNLLDANITALEKIVGKLGGNSKAITLGKNMLRDIVAQKAEIVAGIISAYASDKEMVELEGSMDISAYKLTRMKEEEMPPAVDKLITTASENLANALDYGVNAEMITDLSTSLDDLNEKMGLPRMYSVNKSASIETSEKLIKKTDTLLKKRIDKMMKRYKYTNAEFFSAYTHARKIVDN